MSDNEGNKAGKGWTDRQRLAYFFNLVEFSNVKLDYANAPRPEGKSAGACRVMVDRLKNTLKTELAVLRGEGNDSGEANASPMKKTATTPRKRKAAAAKEADGTPSKKGRKKNGEESGGEQQQEEVKKEEEMGDEFA